MIDSFINYLEFEKKASPHTVEAYRRDLTQFEEFLALSFEINEISEAQHPELRAWVIELVDSGLSTTSVNRKIATLKSYYKFLLRSQIISSDPTYKLKGLKNPKKLPEFVQEETILAVLDESVYEQDFDGQRDKMVMEFLYLTGVRLSELIGLKWSDINLIDDSVKVLGKRKKERIIPITKGLKQNILLYKKVFEERFSKVGQSDYFIVSNQQKQSYPMMIFRIVRHYLDLFAQTQVYTHNSMEKLKAVFEQAHPKA
mgnify:CR=1 FL=1